MRAPPFFISILVALACACKSKPESKPAETATQGDTLVPYQVTVLAELPDSLQPKTFLLAQMPKPTRTVVPKNGGITKMLPVLENKKGEAILDAKGKPYIMGDGGISNFTNLSSDDGLALDAVHCSLLDKFGNLWFGTFGGVSRYDGQSFHTFTTAHGLTTATVWSITEDKSGNLWFGTDGSVSRYDGRTFRTFTTPELGNYAVWSMIEDKAGNLWFGTNGGGVSRYDGKSFRTFTTADGLAQNEVWSITEDKSGNLWFGTGGGVSRYDPSASLRTGSQSFTNFTTAQGLAQDDVWSITEDKSGNLWFGTEGGVSRYDGQSFHTFTTAQGLANNYVWSIREDKSGNLWFGTTGGVSRYDPSASLRTGSQSFSSFTTAQGLANNEVKNITEDKTGNLWFGTLGGGVSRYDGRSFSMFTPTQGLANFNVGSIAEDKTGNLWIGTWRGGVSRYDGQSFVTFTTAQGLVYNSVISITEDKTGNLWFGTWREGVSRYDPSASLRTGSQSFTNFTTAQGLAHNDVWSIREDKAGNLWFGTAGGGLSRYDGQSFTTFTTAQGLADNFVVSIREDKSGNLWFGTSGGVSRYDGQSFSTFTTAQGLAHNAVVSIIEDKTGNLWFGTSGGVSVMRAEEVRSLAENQVVSGAEGTDKSEKTKLISSTLFKSFTIADGLPDNGVIQISLMPDGKIAVGTNLGITLFKPSDDFSQLTEIELYNTNTGYPVKSINYGQDVMFLDSKGILWAGTGSEKTALVRFEPAALKTNNEVPNLVIKGIKVKNENIPWYSLNENPVALDSLTTPAYVTEEAGLFGRKLTAAERDRIRQRFGGIQFDSIRTFYPVPENLVLPYEHNQISLEFVAIETEKPMLVKYQYMLEGYDKDWSPVTSLGNATFGNISEGSYTFKFKARGANGIWTEPVIYPFRVLPPWWRSWWAYGTYISLLMLTFWRIHLFQKAVTIKKEREKIKDRELAQAKEIERAYSELGAAHENLKATQSQLIQSEKMASLGELTAGIAHEIQNPLNFVNNFSEVNKELLGEMNDEIQKGNYDEVKAIAKDVVDNEEKIIFHGKRADGIVKGMLQHSRSSSGVKEPTDINALTDEYLRLAYHGLKAKEKSFNATMKTDFDESLSADEAGIGYVSIIPQDIGRVVLNLINNAFYAVHARLNESFGQEKSKQNIAGYEPTIWVSTRRVDSPLGAGGSGGKIEIKVKDNGNGIPDSIKEKIFQPFFTTKPTGQGTGLGLSLSYDIVKAHGGTLEVESEEGIGTEFVIQLPAKNNGG